MGVPDAAVIASGDPATRAAVRSAVLERFTRLLAGTDSATRTLAARCGEPPTTHIHTREEAATLPEEAVLLGLPPTTTVQRRHITDRRRDGTVLCEARAVMEPSAKGAPGRVGPAARAALGVGAAAAVAAASEVTTAAPATRTPRRRRRVVRELDAMLVSSQQVSVS